SPGSPRADESVKTVIEGFGLVPGYLSDLQSHQENHLGPAVRIRFAPAASPSLNENLPVQAAKPGFPPALAHCSECRDGRSPAPWQHGRRMSLRGQIPVPRCRRWIETDRGVMPVSAAE